MPVRIKSYPDAVDAVSEAIRELSAAATNIERALPDNPHQERCTRVINYEVGELTDALQSLREMLEMLTTPVQQAEPKARRA